MNGKVRGNPKSATVKYRLISIIRYHIISLVIGITLILVCIDFTAINYVYFRTLKTHHHNLAIFLQTVKAIEKLLAAFKVQVHDQNISSPKILFTFCN